MLPGASTEAILHATTTNSSHQTVVIVPCCTQTETVAFSNYQRIWQTFVHLMIAIHMGVADQIIQPRGFEGPDHIRNQSDL